MRRKVKMYWMLTSFITSLWTGARYREDLETEIIKCVMHLQCLK